MGRVQCHLTTIWTNNVQKMKIFYSEVLGIRVKQDLEKYVEFEDEGIRLAICERELMMDYSKDYVLEHRGQRFQMSFMCDNEEQIEYIYHTAIEKGGMGIQPPLVINSHQIAALFGDPDGNIHEVYANI